MINACVFIKVVDLHKYKTNSPSKISLPLKLGLIRINIRKKNTDFTAKLKRIKSVMLRNLSFRMDEYSIKVRD